MKKRLFLLCGIPGSGKTTYINTLKEHGMELNHISRDEIRFSLLDKNDKYFKKENLVFDIFCQKIQDSLDSNDKVATVADATHLNEKSRNRVLDRLDLSNTDVYIITFDIPIDICLKRNANRVGRSLVPEKVIKDMYKGFVHANMNEKHKYKGILYIYD